jgi:hypothetical protein
MGICGPVCNKSGVVAQSAAEHPWPDATANTGSGFKATFPMENYRLAGVATDALARRTTLRP